MVRVLNKLLRPLGLKVLRTRLPLETLRPALAVFAVEMEKQLRKADYKGGWENDDNMALFRRMSDKLACMFLRLRDKECPRQDVREAAADAANYCMMIASNSGLTPFRTWNGHLFYGD